MSMISVTIDALRTGRLPQYNELRAAFHEWRQRVRSRRELMSLDDHELWDIGLRSSDSDHAVSKPFWQH